ncbi:hypothetical protein COLO4_21269 [Corchorus olitorius]|uniref:Uncharacterized protein n=1 Tax=Corchorus olitorius TaxID=93759 RepID=A0A1R3IUE9_9ROSI|nr:hypothetical protein COLO4_21269 [Corchorus olitorius]
MARAVVNQSSYAFFNRLAFPIVASTDLAATNALMPATAMPAISLP